MRIYSFCAWVAVTLGVTSHTIDQSFAVSSASAETILHVDNDYGGSVTQYKFKIDALPHATQVRISGECASACTMYLGHPNVCSAPDTLFRFHGPSVNGTPLQAHEFELLSRIMADYYPEPLRTVFLSRYRTSISTTFDVKAAELATLGVVDLCEN